MMMYSQINWLNVLGLCCDIVGAIFLAKAILFNSARKVAEQSETWMFGNPYLRHALCEQRVDAWMGIPMLTCGFVLQLVGTIYSTEGWIASAISIVALVGFGVAVTMKGKLIAKLERQSEEELSLIRKANAS